MKPEEQRSFFETSNKMAVEYSKNAIKASFILNGMAASVLFARGSSELLHAAKWFAAGAGFATLCCGMSYIIQLMIAALNNPNLPDGTKEIAFSKLFPKASQDNIETARKIAIGCWLVSMAVFFVAVFSV